MHQFSLKWILLLPIAFLMCACGCGDHHKEIQRELALSDQYSYCPRIDSLRTSWQHYCQADSIRDHYYPNESLTQVIPHRLLENSDEQFDAMIEMDDMLDQAAAYCDLSTEVREHMHWYEERVVTILPEISDEQRTDSRRVIELTDQTKTAKPKQVEVKPVDPEEERRKTHEQQLILADKYYQQGQSAEYLCNEYDDEDECARMEHSYERAAHYNPEKYANLLN